MPRKQIETAADLAKSMFQFQMAALRQPQDAMQAMFGATSESIKAMYGQSDVKPEKGDKRFLDPIWQSNPAYSALMKSYLAWSQGVTGWVDGLDADEKAKLRVKLMSSTVTDTLSPTNTLMGNPTAMKATFEEGGANLREGLANFMNDMTKNGGLPSTVDKSKFVVGTDLGVTPGAVVYKEDLLELIQYAPLTDKVYKRPIFIVPPQINKFYIWDLAPGRSIVEFLLEQGHQVFIVSWRNPTEEHSGWGMDDYVGALDRASEVACEITGSDDLNIVGACSGGITASLLQALWAAQGAKRSYSFTLLVAILDVSGADNTSMGLFANLETLELAKMFSRSKGILEGKDLERAFSWLRPNDLIWSYWVNNYLLGKNPPAFDILFWNADTTGLPAKLHADMIDMLEEGGLADGASIEVAGHTADLKKVTCDTFLVAGETDHITPWDGCYLSTKAFGGACEFVLSQSGHIQSLINPPGNPKARYLTNSDAHDSPESFLAGATQNSGSWWPLWANWLGERGGSQVKAKKTLGSKAHAEICPSPGEYVVL